MNSVKKPNTKGRIILGLFFLILLLIKCTRTTDPVSICDEAKTEYQQSEAEYNEALDDFGSTSFDANLARRAQVKLYDLEEAKTKAYRLCK